MRGFSELMKSLGDAIFPPVCILCGKILSADEKLLWICSRCKSGLSPARGFSCPSCRRRVPDATFPCHPDAKFILVAPFEFEDKKIQELIYALKYRFFKKAAIPLSFFMANCLSETFEENNRKDLGEFSVIPVPLHPSKERKRGFNQSLLIAREMGKFIRSGFTVDDCIVRRVKKTKSQTEQKSREERRENVKNCFTLRDGSRIKNKNILLVDDVFTTGATIGELATLLKANGAKKIVAVTAAKT